jgi:hypothetical protein
VGRGVDSRFGEKKLEGSGRTVDWVCGNRKDVFLLLVAIASDDRVLFLWLWYWMAKMLLTSNGYGDDGVFL